MIRGEGCARGRIGSFGLISTLFPLARWITVEVLASYFTHAAGFSSVDLHLYVRYLVLLLFKLALTIQKS